MSDHDEYPQITGLDERQSLAYFLLKEEGLTVEQAAERCGVTARTVHRWKVLQAWMSAEAIWARGAVHSAKMELTLVLGESAGVLIGAMRDSADPVLQFKAATEIMDRAGLPVAKEVAIDHSGTVATKAGPVDLAAINADLATLDAE